MVNVLARGRTKNCGRSHGLLLKNARVSRRHTYPPGIETAWVDKQENICRSGSPDSGAINPRR